MLRKTVSLLLAILLVCGLVPAGVMQAFADDGTNPPEISNTLVLDTPASVGITEGGQHKFCSFTAPENRVYTFQTQGSIDTKGTLYNSSMTWITDDDDSGEGYNFLIEQRLNAGQTYYLEVYYYNASLTGSTNVSVTAKPYATSLTIDPSGSFTGYAGTTQYLSATLAPEDCMYENIVWTSSDDQIVTVPSGSNEMQLLSPGTATLTATSERGLTASLTVTVLSAQPIALNEVKHCTVNNPNEKFMFKFTAPESRNYVFYSTGSFDTQATLFDSDMTTQLDFADDYEGDSNFRLVHRLTANHEYYIQANIYSNNTGSFDFTVEAVPYAQSIDIGQGSSIELVQSNMISLDVLFMPQGSPYEDLTYTSSNPGVVSVDANGIVTAQNPGTAVITATSERGLTDSITVTVPQPETISPGDVKNAEITTPGHHAIYRFIPSVTNVYCFSSVCSKDTRGNLYDSDLNLIASNDDYGNSQNFYIEEQLTAGETYYICGEFYNTSELGTIGIKLNIKIDPTSVSIAQGSAINGRIGGTVTLTPSFTPAGATVSTYTWQSSNTNIATVDQNGVVTFKAAGTANITYTTGNSLSATCTVTVTDAEVIGLGQTKVFQLEADSSVVYKVVPDSYFYGFFSTDGYCDTYGELLSQDGSQLAFSNDGSVGSNFSLGYSLDGDQYYYIRVSLRSGSGGQVTLHFDYERRPNQLVIDDGETYFGMSGSTHQLTTYFLPSGSSSENITWSSDDDSVASVSSSGLVSFHAEGSTVINAVTPRGLTASITVQVSSAVPLNIGDSATANITQSFQKTYYRLTPAEDTYAVFYSQGDEDTYAELYNSDLSEQLLYNDDGGENNNFRLSTLLEGGQTYYLAVKYLGSQTGSFSVYSTAIPVAQSISLSQGSAITVYLNTSFYLNTEAHPQNGYIGDIDWSITDTSVAYNSGYEEFYANAVGTTVITVTSETGLSTTCTVTVIDYESLAVGETKNANIDYTGKEIKYRFVPAQTYMYTFYSEGDLDTIATLYDNSGNSIGSDDDSGEYNNFRLSAMLEAGQTYCLAVSAYNNRTGAFSVTALKTEYPTALEIIKEPDRTTYVEGYLDGYVEYDGMKARVTWSDNAQTDWEYGNTSMIRGMYLDIYTEDNNIIVKIGDCTATVPLTVVPNTVESLTVVGQTSKTLIENADGQFINYSNDPYFQYSYGEIKDITLWIDYTDGTSRFVSTGDLVDGYKINCYDDQSSEHWTLGNNPIYISYLGVETTAQIAVVENPVQSIEVIKGPDRTLIENTSGYIDTYYNPTTHTTEEFFYYNIDYTGAEIRVNYKDGTTAIGSVENYLNGYKISATANQYTAHFTLGSNNEAEVSYMGHTATMNLTVEPNPVESLVVVSEPTKHLIENCGGFVENRYDPVTGTTVEYFNYELYLLGDAVIRINYKNGGSVESKINRTVNGYRISYYADQESTPFTVGGNNIFYAEYMGKKVALHAVVDPNPVESLELAEPVNIELYEYADGYTESVYNPVTNENDLTRFVYSLKNPQDISVRINYKNGTSKTAHIYDSVDGYGINLYSDQYSEWTVGQHSFEVRYLGKTLAIPVTVVQNPVDHIEVIHNTSKTLIENSDGAWEYVSYSGSNKFFFYDIPDLSDAVVRIYYTNGTTTDAHIDDKVNGYYIRENTDQYDNHFRSGENLLTVTYMGRETQMPIYVVPTNVQSITIVTPPTKVYMLGDNYYGYGEYFNPNEYAGLEFTVNYNNGTSKTYTSADINGNKIDGHRFYSETAEPIHLGDNTVTFGYLGVTAEYNVRVTENNIASIELVKLPDSPVLSDYYSVDWTGTQFRITKTDGTSSVVTLNDSNIVYGFSNEFAYYPGFVYEGITGAISSAYNGENPLYRASYAGKSCNITGIENVDNKEISDVQIQNFSPTAENMVFRLTYADGTTENVQVLKVLDCRKYWNPNENYVRAKTTKGILIFYIVTSEAPDCMVYAYGKNIKVNYPVAQNILGDANGDGVVNIQDVTIVQRYIAEFSVSLPERIRTYCDVDGNGRVDVKDVTCLQRSVAGLENPYNIGQAVS